MDDDTEIKQGFLCPLCMEDLGELERLHQHVDTVHSTDTNTDAINMLRGMFAKAKLKLNEIDFTRNLTGQLPSTDPRNTSSSNYGNEYQLNAPQVLGVLRSHTDYFVETQREHNEISTVHTNTLIIRLDKLLHENTSAGTNRKDFEKRTVPWADDSDYTNCRVCNVKFSLTKRKHHCRLCGKIICATCSKFLSFLSAQKITSFVSKPQDADVETIEDNENYMRICAMCKEYLQRYELRKDLNSVSSVFIDLYAKLTTLITQINNLTPSYRRMAMSLQNGESLYTLESATQLKKKIIYIQSEIKNLSERIEKWGLDNDPIAPRKPTHREKVVQYNIRAFALMTLQEIIRNMPEIPPPDEYERLHKQHKEKVMNREKARPFYIEDNHRDEPDSQRRSNPTINRLGRTESTSSDVGTSTVNGTSGNSTVLRPSASFSSFPTDSWAPSTPNRVSASKKNSNPFFCDDGDEDVEQEEPPHPFAQQYLILKGYLDQAVEAGRLDEAEALKTSLDELKEELEKLGLATPRAP